MASKEDLREKYFEKRQSLSNKFINEKSKLIIDKLRDYVIENAYENIMIFVSFRNEIKTHDLIKSWLNDNQKNIFVPYIDKDLNEMRISKIDSFENDLIPGVFDILEPREELKSNKKIKELDLIVVPGLIFSQEGYRIGYGGGYYDKFLAEIDRKVDKVGIAFSDFVVDTLPVDDYDQPVDKLITEKEIISFTRWYFD